MASIHDTSGRSPGHWASDIIVETEVEDITPRTASSHAHRIEQRIGDLDDATHLSSQLAFLRDAYLVFIDVLQARRDPLHPRQTQDRRYLVGVDDFPFLPRGQLWCVSPQVKLDATSLNHGSGVGMLRTL